MCVDSCRNGEHGSTLEEATLQRQQLLKVYEVIDIIR